jgi:hypothetical protein
MYAPINDQRPAIAPKCRKYPSYRNGRKTATGYQKSRLDRPRAFSFGFPKHLTPVPYASNAAQCRFTSVLTESA